MIKGLDREQFEVVVFSSTKKDEWTKGLADATDFHHLPTGMLISNRELVLQQNLDVLVFPDIGMDTKTAMWGGARLAPVQICFWGHPTTTGMHSMDYFVTSDSFEPNDAQGRFTEQVMMTRQTRAFVHLGLSPPHHPNTQLPTPNNPTQHNTHSWCALTRPRSTSRPRAGRSQT